MHSASPANLSVHYLLAWLHVAWRRSNWVAVIGGSSSLLSIAELPRAESPHTRISPSQSFVSVRMEGLVQRMVWQKAIFYRWRNKRSFLQQKRFNSVVV